MLGVLSAEKKLARDLSLFLQKLHKIRKTCIPFILFFQAILCKHTVAVTKNKYLLTYLIVQSIPLKFLNTFQIQI